MTSFSLVQQWLLPVNVLFLLLSPFASAWDPCRNDNHQLGSVLWNGVEVTCIAVVHENYSDFGLDPFIVCSEPLWASACPLQCGRCDDFGPPVCDEDVVFQEKSSLVVALKSIGVCEDCRAPEVWSEHRYKVNSPTEWIGVFAASWTTDDPLDPCSVGGVTCNRCGEVMSVVVGFGNLPQPPVYKGTLHPAIAELSGINELLFQADAIAFESIPESSRFYFPGEAWRRLQNLSSLRMGGALYGDVPELSDMPNLLHIFFNANELYGSTASLFGSPLVTGLIFRRVSSSTLEPATIPEGICNMQNLIELHFEADARLYGRVPDCANMPELRHLAWKGANISGRVTSLISSPYLVTVELDHNFLSGSLPESLSQAVDLEAMSIAFNRITGTIPDLSACTRLEWLVLAGNLITGAKAIGGSFAYISLALNQIQHLPDDFFDLPGVSVLDLSWNNISYWPPAGVYERGTHAVTGHPQRCGGTPLEPRSFNWPFVEQVVLSGNNLQLQDVRDVLGSLAHLPRIRVVMASYCNMSKDLPMEGIGTMLSTFDLRNCILLEQPAFHALVHLNLAYNQIEALRGGPWEALDELLLAGNALTYIHPAFFSFEDTPLQRLVLSGNERLQLPVQDLGLGRCPSPGEPEYSQLTGLTFDPRSYSTPVLGSECGALCSYFNMQITVDPQANVSVMCRCIPGWYGSGRRCTSCPTDHYCPLGVSEPKQCPTHSGTVGLEEQESCEDCLCDAGYYRNPAVPFGECKQTQEGRANESFCKPCPQHTFRPVPGALSADECSLCPSGRFTATVGSTGFSGMVSGGTNGTVEDGNVCDECLPGSEPAGGAGTGCQLCAPGHFEDELRSACSPCPRGQYQPEAGHTECIECTGPHNTTWDCGAVGHIGCRNASSCACEAGYRPIGADCVQCGHGEQEGLQCAGGLEDGAVEVLPGYFSEEDISLYYCWGDTDRCAGGLPGLTCAMHRVGLTCSLCQDGFAPTNNGGCEECEGKSIVRLVIIPIVCLGLLIVFYYSIDSHSRAKQKYSEVVITSCISLCVTVIQQYGLLARSSVEWTGPIREFLDFFTFTIDLDLMHVDCVSRQTPTTKFIVTVSLFLVLGLLMSIIHVVFVVVRHKGHFRERRASLMCSWGAVMSLCYISVVTTNTGPLQCQQHPNRKWTTRAYPGVLCWTTSEHTGMVAASLVASMVPLAFLAHAVYTVVRYPERVALGDLEFIKAYNFYFIRFKVDRYWFILVQIVRNLLMALSTTIPEEAAAVFTAVIVLIMAGGLTVHYHPWRCWEANYLDLLLLHCILLLYIASFSFMLVQDSVRLQISWVCTLSSAAALLLVPIIILMAAIRKYRLCAKDSKLFEFFLTHHKAGAGAFTRLLKMYLVDTQGTFKHVQREVFVDSDSLVHLDRLFHHVRDETERLVAVCSRELLFRPWCVGELATARLAGVPVIAVLMPDFLPITDAFVEDYPFELDLSALFEYGITLESIKEALSWFRNQPRIVMPQRLSPKAMEELSHTLRRRDLQRPCFIHNQAGTEQTELPNEPVCILADISNSEAVASGMVLEKILFRMQWKGLTPFNLPAGHLLPTGIDCVMVICSGGCLESESLLAWLSAAAGHSLPTLPVVVEEGFRFPSAAGNTSYRTNSGTSTRQLTTAPSVATPLASQPTSTHLSEGSQSTLHLSLQSFIQAMFKGIAVSFLTQQSSEEALWLAAKSIARRLADLIRDRNGEGFGQLPFVLRSSCDSGHQSSSSILNRQGNGDPKLISLADAGSEDQDRSAALGEEEYLSGPVLYERNPLDDFTAAPKLVQPRSFGLVDLSDGYSYLAV